MNCRLKRSVVFLLGTIALPISAEVLDRPEHGTLVKVDGKFAFRIDEKRMAQRTADFDIWKQWVVGAELQAPIPHRPKDHILTGGVGHFNIGMAGPQSGIPIFLAVGDEQPRLVGITDANGKFAIKLPPKVASGGVCLYFSGTIGVIEDAQEKGKPLASFGGDVDVTAGRFVLAVDSRSERYRLKLPNDTKPAPGQTHTESGPE